MRAGEGPTPFLSRHFLGVSAFDIASVSFPQAGPEDHEGKSLHHNILCVAGWSADAQVRPETDVVAL